MSCRTLWGRDRVARTVDPLRPPCSRRGLAFLWRGLGGRREMGVKARPAAAGSWTSAGGTRGQCCARPCKAHAATSNERQDTQFRRDANERLQRSRRTAFRSTAVADLRGPGEARGGQGWSGMARGGQGRSGSARGGQGRRGVVRDGQGRPGVARGSEGWPGAARAKLAHLTRVLPLPQHRPVPRFPCICYKCKLLHVNDLSLKNTQPLRATHWTLRRNRTA